MMFPTSEPYAGPITTSDSKKSERLVVDAGQKAKRKKSLQARVKEMSSTPYPKI